MKWIRKTHVIQVRIIEGAGIVGLRALIGREFLLTMGVIAHDGEFRLFQLDQTSWILGCCGGIVGHGYKRSPHAHGPGSGPHRIGRAGNAHLLKNRSGIQVAG